MGPRPARSTAAMGPTPYAGAPHPVRRRLGGRCPRGGRLQPPALFRWRDRLDAEGIAGLVDRSRPDDRSDLAPELERAILPVRLPC
jgi:hypothetical protein